MPHVGKETGLKEKQGVLDERTIEDPRDVEVRMLRAELLRCLMNDAAKSPIVQVEQGASEPLVADKDSQVAEIRMLREELMQCLMRDAAKNPIVHVNSVASEPLVAGNAHGAARTTVISTSHPVSNVLTHNPTSVAVEGGTMPAPAISICEMDALSRPNGHMHFAGGDPESARRMFPYGGMNAAFSAGTVAGARGGMTKAPCSYISVAEGYTVQQQHGPTTTSNVNNGEIDVPLEVYIANWRSRVPQGILQRTACPPPVSEEQRKLHCPDEEVAQASVREKYMRDVTPDQQDDELRGACCVWTREDAWESPGRDCAANAAAAQKIDDWRIASNEVMRNRLVEGKMHQLSTTCANEEYDMILRHVERLRDRALWPNTATADWVDDVEVELQMEQSLDEFTYGECMQLQQQLEVDDVRAEDRKLCTPKQVVDNVSDGERVQQQRQTVAQCDIDRRSREDDSQVWTPREVEPWNGQLCDVFLDGKDPETLQPQCDREEINAEILETELQLDNEFHRHVDDYVAVSGCMWCPSVSHEYDLATSDGTPECGRAQAIEWPDGDASLNCTLNRVPRDESVDAPVALLGCAVRGERGEAACTVGDVQDPRMSDESVDGYRVGAQSPIEFCSQVETVQHSSELNVWIELHLADDFLRHVDDQAAVKGLLNDDSPPVKGGNLRAQMNALMCGGADVNRGAGVLTCNVTRFLDLAHVVMTLNAECRGGKCPAAEDEIIPVLLSTELQMDSVCSEEEMITCIGWTVHLNSNNALDYFVKLHEHLRSPAESVEWIHEVNSQWILKEHKDVAAELKHYSEMVKLIHRQATRWMLHEEEIEFDRFVGDDDREMKWASGTSCAINRSWMSVR